MNRGCYKYNPKELLDELNEVKINLKIDKDAEALRKIAEFSAIGRDLDNILKFHGRRKK